MKPASARKYEWLEPYQFKAGVSGNRSGRGTALASRIKELTANGIEMADVMVQIMRGQKIKGVYGMPSYKDVREAAMWLAEQVFGRAPVKLDTGDGQSVDLLKIIYMELHKTPPKDGDSDLRPQHTIDAEWSSPAPGQDMETQQSLQNKIQDGNPEIQTKSNSD